MVSKLRTFVSLVTCHPLATIGSTMATFGAMLVFLYMFYASTLSAHNAYAGAIFLLTVVPAFMGGLVFIPLGIYLRLKKMRRETGEKASVWDLSQSLMGKTSFRVPLLVFGLLSAVNFVIVMLIAYSSYHYMETNSFCGKVCHTVMEPEFTAHARSPHNRVNCVDCHIGSGADWFVKSKISGSRQLLNVALGTYARPIESPVKHLRPARETCEQCHWPEKFHDNRLKVLRHYAQDEANTPLYTVLLMKTGGPTVNEGQGAGIHWHVAEGNKVSYISHNDARHTIYWVRYERAGAEPVEYHYTGSDLTAEQIAQAPKRTMDCVDCHNRPTHIFEVPEQAMARVLSFKPQLRKLPFANKLGLEVLQKEFSEQAIVSGAVRETFVKHYREYQPNMRSELEPLLVEMAEQIQVAYRQNVWPRMNITWGTYPSHGSHIHSPGCLRCHNNNYRTKEGVTINSDCRICHAVVAEKQPAAKVAVYLQ